MNKSKETLAVIVAALWYTLVSAVSLLTPLGNIIFDSSKLIAIAFAVWLICSLLVWLLERRMPRFISLSLVLIALAGAALASTNSLPYGNPTGWELAGLILVPVLAGAIGLLYLWWLRREHWPVLLGILLAGWVFGIAGKSALVLLLAIAR